jgi:hypothetical protein
MKSSFMDAELPPAGKTKRMKAVGKDDETEWIDQRELQERGKT